MHLIMWLFGLVCISGGILAMGHPDRALIFLGATLLITTLIHWFQDDLGNRK